MNDRTAQHKWSCFNSWITSVLGEEGIEIIIFDKHISIKEGSAFVIPGRVMVHKDDYTSAKMTFESAVQDRDGDVGYYEYPTWGENYESKSS